MLSTGLQIRSVKLCAYIPRDAILDVWCMYASKNILGGRKLATTVGEKVPE